MEANGAEAGLRTAAGPQLGERITPITLHGDRRLADYMGLSDAALRRQSDPANGRYIAEGTKVINRALAAGHLPRSFLMAPKRLAGLAGILAAYPQVPVFVGSDEVLEAVTGFHLHRGALAAMDRPAALELGSVLEGATRVAVLEDMVDHTNLGATFRSGAALGIDAVLLTPRSADPLYRRAVRVSMGAVFQVPWVRLDSWPAGLAALSAAGFRTAAMELASRAVDIGQVAGLGIERLALVLGTEGAGVSEAVLQNADMHVAIPMRPGMDSLNVAAASAIAFWELRNREP